MDLNNIQSYLLKEIADIDGNNLTGAYNIRSDSMSIGRQSTENIRQRHGYLHQAQYRR